MAITIIYMQNLCLPFYRLISKKSVYFLNKCPKSSRRAYAQFAGSVLSWTSALKMAHQLSRRTLEENKKAWHFSTIIMINYHIKLLSTHDLKLKRAISDKSFKSRAVLMGKIWKTKRFSRRG